MQLRRNSISRFSKATWRNSWFSRLVLSVYGRDYFDKDLRCLWGCRFKVCGRLPTQGVKLRASSVIVISPQERGTVYWSGRVMGLVELTRMCERADEVWQPHNTFELWVVDSFLTPLSCELLEAFELYDLFDTIERWWSVAEACVWWGDTCPSNMK